MLKINQCLRLAVCALGLAVFSTKLTAADTSAPKPDLLKTCPVSGEKLDGDMGKPFVFAYKDQEVKLCCKSCKKDFDKNPDKYLKVIRAADKK